MVDTVSMEARRWYEDRLNDLIARMDRYATRLQAVEDDVELIGRIDERLKSVESKVDTCIKGTEDLEHQLRVRDQLALEEYKASRIDQRNNRRWMIGSLIAFSGVITGAVGLIVAVLDKAPQ